MPRISRNGVDYGVILDGPVRVDMKRVKAAHGHGHLRRQPECRA